MLRSLFYLLLLTGTLHSQAPIAIHTSDPRYAARWETIPAPTLPLYLESHHAGWAEGKRPPGTYEIAYCLADEYGDLSPVSPPVTVTTTTSEWAAVGTCPGVPLWARVSGIFWVYRQAGTTEWMPFATDVNRSHQWLAAKPYRPITVWDHCYCGQILYQAGNYPSLSSTFYKTSLKLPNAPPQPEVRIFEQRNVALNIAFSWPCNEGETTLSPVLHVPALPNTPADRHKTMRLLRASPAGKQQPPQGALGMYVYAQEPGGQWHRQPSIDGNGYLWPLDFVSFDLPCYVQSGIQPQAGGGRSWLSRLHVALRDWDRDIVVDYDELICCPLVSEYTGAAWKWTPKNHWTALYHTSLSGTWTLTIDGKSTPAMPIVIASNQGTEWPSYQAAMDATFGPGNVLIGFFWHNYAPRITFHGKYAAADMTGRYAIQVRDVADAPIQPAIIAGAGYLGGPQQDDGIGKAWTFNDAGGEFKFKRTIGTANGGSFRISDTDTTPNGITGYPTGWGHWLECTQRTVLRGADFTMVKSRCAISSCDNSGGGSFHFNLINGTIGLHPSNTQQNTHGFRCLAFSNWTTGGHLCSELVIEKLHAQARWPIICEGNQAANWMLRDVTLNSTGKFQSALITQSNAGDLVFGGRCTGDNARALLASGWSKRTKLPEIWVDGGIPCLSEWDCNSFGTLQILGGKINQWEQDQEDIIEALVFHGWGRDQLESMNGWDLRTNFSREMSHWIHATNSPAGALVTVTLFGVQVLVPDERKRALITEELDSQHDWFPDMTRLPDAKMVGPYPAQAQFKPRNTDDYPVTTLLQRLLPLVVQP